MNRNSVFVEDSGIPSPKIHIITRTAANVSVAMTSERHEEVAATEV